MRTHHPSSLYPILPPLKPLFPLQDEDPYVRKTAAVCVAKLHDISSARVEDQGFLETLGELLCDSNPMVVANAVAALSEILDTNPNAAKQVILIF